MFTTDTRQIIAYVQRSKITDWKRLMDLGVASPSPSFTVVGIGMYSRDM